MESDGERGASSEIESAPEVGEGGEAKKDVFIYSRKWRREKGARAGCVLTQRGVGTYTKRCRLTQEGITTPKYMCDQTSGAWLAPRTVLVSCWISTECLRAERWRASSIPFCRTLVN